MTTRQVQVDSSHELNVGGNSRTRHFEFLLDGKDEGVNEVPVYRLHVPRALYEVCGSPVEQLGVRWPNSGDLRSCSVS